MMAVGGTWGKILHVDVTDGSRWLETPGDEVYLRLIGGRGLVAYLLLRHTPAGVDALGPENVLIFAPGVLQGSNLPSSGRHGVGAKSPLTGAIASSEAGGWWGHEFKRTGYDALVIHGRAPAPVYLSIKDGEVSLRPAEHLWGRDTADVQATIRAELGDDKVRVAQIGVAGENGVLFSAIMHDVNRAAGRNGLGAVMGSKNLKAVAVRGTQNVPQGNRQRLMPVAKWIGQDYKQSMEWAVSMGTPGSVYHHEKTSNLPVRNFQEPRFPDAKSIDGKLMAATIRTDRDTCQACPVYCKQVVKYEGQAFPDQPLLKTTLIGKTTIDGAYGGPEYETLGAFGSACGVTDLIAVAKANEMCARWGLDTISTGMTISYIMELADRGLLGVEQTGGFLPKWGDGEAVLEAVDMIAHCRDFGERMAQGSKRISQWVGQGSEAYLVEVKGLELAMHDPRTKVGLGLGYAVAPVGADHMMNIHDGEYSSPGGSLDRVAAVYPIEPMPVTVLDEKKVELFYHEVNWKHFMDCAVVCMFYPYNYVQLAEAVSGATGHDYMPQDILLVGERAQQLCRLFNLREGLTAADDRIPKRIMQPFADGPAAGVEITEEDFLAARQQWYGMMGWTPEGVPMPERLAELGLSELLA
jgi:aldehyde:ferredoxin oxidoreductase